MKSYLRSRLAGALCLLAPLSASATLGVYEQGNGIKSMGKGGVGYSTGDETTVLGANPAHAATLPHRADIGVDVFYAEATATYRDNDFGPDQTLASDGRSYYAIPQGGYSRPLADGWGIGLTMLSAGLGPDYGNNPYERFGGSHRGVLSLVSSSLVLAVGKQLNARHSLGASLNLGYQVLSVKGLEFLANDAVSSRPQNVTGQGRDAALSIGYSVGYKGQLTPWLAVGAAYRSKSWTQEHEEYRGLIANGGKLELPAIWGGGFTLTPLADWTVALEAQRYEYRAEDGFRNGIGTLDPPNKKLGDRDGPGFGLNDQNAYKLGVAWQARPDLVLRAGYIYATQMVNSGETLFGFLGCITGTTQYGAGFTYTRNNWEWTGYGYHMPKKTVRGENSIPDDFGGGEADVSDTVYGLGFSLGRRFGGS